MTPTAEVENREEQNYSERAKVAMGVLEDIFRFCKFDIQPNLIHDKAEELQIAMVGPDSQRMIGPRGDTLLAAQFLVNRIVARKLEGEQMVVLDAANYRERRMNALEELAVRLAERAEKDQKIVRLSPMSPHDRRVFHQTLSERDGVRTESHGDGIYRNLLIIPSAYQAAN